MSAMALTQGRSHREALCTPIEAPSRWTTRIEADVVSQDFCAYHAEIFFKGRLMCRILRAGPFITREAAGEVLGKKLDRWRAEFELREHGDRDGSAPAPLAS